MKKKYTQPLRRLKISDEIREAYARRDKTLDNDPDAPLLPPEMWENALIGKFYRPIKTAVSARIDNDVLDWLKSKGEGHITRINEILRNAMLADLKER